MKLFISFQFYYYSIVQVAFGIKINSLVEKNNPVITYAQQLLSTDLSFANLIRFTLIFMAPKVANFIGVRLNAEAIDYFGEFSNKIMADKRKLYSKSNHGKASNFIELMLEAEVENCGESFSSAFQTEEKEKLKCMLWHIFYF